MTKLPDLKPVAKHRLTDFIERIFDEHLKYDLVDDLTNSNIWELLCQDGEMKVYRMEKEENGNGEQSDKNNFYSILLLLLLLLLSLF